MPHLNNLASQFGPRGFHVVAVSDESSREIEPYVRDKGINYGVVSSGAGVIDLYNGSGYPSAWLVGPDGRVVWEGHPLSLQQATIEQALVGATNATPATPGSSINQSGSNWWIWLIGFAGLFFVGALGWFWWSTRDNTPRNLQTGYYAQPGAQYPVGNAPPPGQAPPPGPTPPPQPGQYGAQPQYGQQQAPAQPSAYGGAPAPQQTGYNAPLPSQDEYSGTAGVGGNNLHGGTGPSVSNTEFRQKNDNAPYLGGNQQPPAGGNPPSPPNQPPELPPYNPHQGGRS